MKEIQLSKNGKKKGKYVALVDDEDFEYLNQFNWYADKSKNRIYARTSIKTDNGRKIKSMHTIIMNDKIIDHIDRNGLNCQKYNMRPCTQIQNNKNVASRKDSRSIYKGIYLYKQRNKWLASITSDGKRIYLGLFTNEIDAAKAYDEAAKIYHKEFACLNFK